MDLTELLPILEQVAPLDLAEPWDNVGLLVDPRQALGCGRLAPYRVDHLVVAIDATPEVFAELGSVPHAVLYAYHPPLFGSVKRVVAEDLMMHSVRSGVPIYSPHTALDAVAGGVNDWLAAGVGPGKVTAAVAQVTGGRGAPALTEASLPVGAGRCIELEEPTALEEVVQRLKVHLGVERLRLAAAARHRLPTPDAIERVVVCPGSGGSVFDQSPAADLFVTGECGHHEVLRCLRRGASVLLSEHTTTERGYLPQLVELLSRRLGGQVRVRQASSDVEVLSLV